MSFLNFLKKERRSGAQQQDRGILVFQNTSEVIRAENALIVSGMETLD
jgi:hypothetical protein